MAKKTSMEMAYLKEIAKFKKLVKSNVTEIYACLIKVMYEKGISVDDIIEIVNASQQAWIENVDRYDTMIKWCEEVTGIELESI